MFNCYNLLFLYDWLVTIKVDLLWKLVGFLSFVIAGVFLTLFFGVLFLARVLLNGRTLLRSTPQHTRSPGTVCTRACARPPHTEYVMSAPAQWSSWLRFRPVFSCWSLPLIDSSVLVYHSSAKLNGVLSWQNESHRCFLVCHTIFNTGILFHIYLMFHVNCSGSYEYLSHSE